MIECLILGDSIAVGTAQARPECCLCYEWNQYYTIQQKVSAKICW